MSQTRSGGPSRARTSRTAPRRAGASASRSSAPVLDRSVDPAEATDVPPDAAAPPSPSSPRRRGRWSPGRSLRRRGRTRAEETTSRADKTTSRAGKPSTRRRRVRTERPADSPRLPRPSALAILRSPRHRLLVVCTGVLATGMLCVLLLNTIISQGAFRQHELELALIHASESEERLSRQAQLAEAPLEVERRARALGMVPAAAPVFLRLSDGAVLGDPVPAAPAPGKVSFAGAPGWQTPKPQPSPSAAAQSTEAPATTPQTGSPASPSPTPTPSPSATGTPAPSSGTGTNPTPQEATP